MLCQKKRHIFILSFVPMNQSPSDWWCHITLIRKELSGQGECAFLSKTWQATRCKSPKVCVNLWLTDSRMERWGKIYYRQSNPLQPDHSLKINTHNSHSWLSIRLLYVPLFAFFKRVHQNDE